MKNLINILTVIPCVGHDEEPGRHIEVEGDVHHDNQHTTHLQKSSLNPFFVEVFQYEKINFFTMITTPQRKFLS